MQLRARHYLTALLAASAAAFGSAGCAESESMLFVKGVVALEPGRCDVSTDGSTKVLLGGVMDNFITDSYPAVLLIGSQLASRGSRQQVRTETHRITIRGAVIRVFTVGGSLVTEYTMDAAGFVDPDSSGSATFGAAQVVLIPPNTVGEGTYRVNVSVFGETLGGQAVESGEYTYPITVCNRCLVSCPVNACVVNPATGVDCSSVWACNSPQAPSSSEPCFLGVDARVDCRFLGGQGC